MRINPLSRHVLDLRLLGFDFRLQHVRRIGLAYIRQLMSRRNRVLCQCHQFLAHANHFLRRQGGVEALSDCSEHSISLLGNSNFIRTPLLFVNVAPQPQLSTEHKRLLHVSALLASPEGAAAYLISLITDRRIRIEPCLTRQRARMMNHRLRLPQGRICRQCDLLKFLKPHGRAGGLRECVRKRREQESNNFCLHWILPPSTSDAAFHACAWARAACPVESAPSPCRTRPEAERARSSSSPA